MTEDTMSLADFSWKELFTDTVLQQLIEKGIANNTDLNIARLKVREAEALLTSSKLAVFAFRFSYSAGNNQEYRRK